MIKTPILFLIYNRPEQTALSFRSICNANPECVYIAADGPRKKCSMDEYLCSKTREVVESEKPPFIVNRLYRDSNMGCRLAVSSAIDWFFENVSEGIIIEDDCVPGEDFFIFCEQLLRRYSRDERVMHIGGYNHLGEVHGERGDSYFFSKYSPVWGWATWRRAWEKYDVEMKKYPQVLEKNILQDIYENISERRFRRRIWDKVYNGRIDTWDYQWNFSVRINNGLSIIPTKNLVENIGFDVSATHTVLKQRNCGCNKVRKLTGPIVHPQFFSIDRKIDNRIFKKHIYKNLKDKFFSKVSVSCC